MASITTLRDLGEHCALVLSIYDGKDFAPPDVHCQIYVVASLESKEVMQSEPIDFTSDTPEFNVELVWTMSRQTFQALRSRKALLKVEIKSKQPDESIKVLGTHLLDLREAIPRNEGQIDESCIVHAIWRKLKSPDLKPGKSGPCIKTALTIEPSEPEANEEEDKTMVDIDEDLKTEVADPVVTPDRESLSPILNHDRGFFALGLESSATHIFLFNIFVCFGRDVSRAFPKDIKVSGNEYGHFCYDLFGTQITSKKFQFSKLEDFKPERATAKLFTTPEKLVRFFNTKLNRYTFYVTATSTNNELAYAEVDLSDLIKDCDLDELQSGKLFAKDCVLPLNPITKGRDIYSTPNRGRIMSESMTDTPSMGVRISVGLKPDVGLNTENSTNEPLREEIENAGVWAPIPTKVEAKKSSPEQSQNDIQKTVEKEVRETDSSAVSEQPDIVMEPKTMEVDSTTGLDESVNRYKFSVDLKKIKLNLNYKINCVIKYRYRPFCATEVTTEPAFSIAPEASEAQEIRRGYCEYNFSAKESVLLKPLERYPLHVNVYDNDHDVFLGTASVKLNTLFSSDAVRTIDTRSCSQQVPILKKNNFGSADVIGFIYCKITLKELPPTTTIVESTAPKSAFTPVKPVRDMDKIALELEEWKKKQKDRFKDQLQGLESHHIQTLSKEWEKREKERENVVHDKMNEIMQIEKDLKKALEENKQRSKQLDAYEAKLNERSKKLDEREERLKTVLGKQSRVSIDKVQDKVKDLQKDNEALKAEAQQWKAKYESLLGVKEELNALKKEVSTLRAQNHELQKSKTTVTEKVNALTKTNEFYKKAYQDAEDQVKQLHNELNNQRNNQLTEIKEENVKLKHEMENLRKLHEKSLVKFMTNSSLQNANSQENTENDVTFDLNTVIDANKEKEIERLKSQKQLFLSTRVYKESDYLIKMIDAKIKQLSE